MEETNINIEIPENTEQTGWQPPVLTQEEKRTNRSRQRCTDVFWMQYLICILLLTALFVVRLYDTAVFAGMVERFREQTQAPSAFWAEQLITQIQQLWS